MCHAHAIRSSALASCRGSFHDRAAEKARRRQRHAPDVGGLVTIVLLSCGSFGGFRAERGPGLTHDMSIKRFKVRVLAARASPLTLPAPWFGRLPAAASRAAAEYGYAFRPVAA